MRILPFLLLLCGASHGFIKSPLTGMHVASPLHSTIAQTSSLSEHDVHYYNKRMEQHAGQVHKLEGILLEMKQQNVEPNVVSYSFLLDSLEDGQRAEDILDLLKNDLNHQSTVLYNKVLTVWKKENNLRRAQKLFDFMRDQKLADPISHSCLIGILALQNDLRSAQQAQALAESLSQPNTQVWNTVMHGWINAGDMEQAENILEALEFNLRQRRLSKQQQRDESNTIPLPNAVSYSILMEGWAKRNKVDRVEELFEDMVLLSKRHAQCLPNMYSYVSLINCYARQKSAIYATKAEKMLRQMQDSSDSSIKPNTQLVTAVMDAWQKAGLPERSEALLQWMIDLYKETGDRSILPNEYSFSTAITGWARSSHGAKIYKARALLMQMKELHQKNILPSPPNTHCYTAVLNSCAYSSQDDREQALKIAIVTYRELQEHSVPNQVSYSSMLTALRNLVPTSPKRTVAIQDVFQAAVSSGYVDENVVRHLQKALHDDDLHSLIPNFYQDIRVEELPSAWRRNVVA